MSNPPCYQATGNVVPILNEVRHALERLMANGETTTIDLRALPMGPGEEDAIAEHLGKGEVQIHLEALGTSEVVETLFPGVWHVTHYNTEGEILGKFIEIARVPEIIVCPTDDLGDGLHAISALLNNL